MSELKTVLFTKFFLILLILSANATISAQSTIFNTPSTDVLAKKTFYLEGDFTTHFDKYARGGFESYGYRMVYGLTRKAEVGVNFYISRNGMTAPKEFQTNFKYRVFAKEKYGIAVSAGTQIYVPLDKSAGDRTFGMVYTNVSKVVTKTRGTRFTGGFYNLVGVSKGFGTRKGATLAVEQPLIRKLNFTADWFSGKNRFGYSAAGFSYAIGKRQFFQIGYNFGNSGRGNNALSAFYGITY